MKIIPLSEGSFTIDKTKKFIPFDDEADKLHQRPAGSLLVEIQPFVVQTEKEIILLDTGLGFSDAQGKMQIHQNLVAAGIQPSQVTKVFMSHLHKDHAGAVSEDKNRQQLCFPDATYYVRRDEFDFAIKKGTPSFLPEEFQLLENAGQVEWITQDEGLIDGLIQYQVTGAHSPFHQVCWIRENYQTIFFGADDAPQLQQMKHRFAAKYDHDGKKAMELRTEWWERGQEEKWTFLFYHDIKTPVFGGSAGI